MTAVVPVHVPERSLRSEARAARTIWRRDLIRFADDPRMILSWLLQPLLFLFVLGYGLESLSSGSGAVGDVDLTTFMFPGVVVMALTYSAIFSAASLVWDRELGFLREVLVAPVGRASIIAGKCLGGTTVAASQGLLVLVLAGLVHVPYDPVLLLGLFGLELLVGFAVTAFGVLVAVSIRQAQTFTQVVQLLVFPMIFLSGALYPVSGLPVWLGGLNRLNPLSYAVDPMRRLVFAHLSDAAPPEGLTWWGWPVPTALEVAMVVVMGLAMMGVAIRRFARTE